MKTVPPKAKRASSITLESARSAAKAVRGDRPAGRFLVEPGSKTKAVHERFLGEIVHGAKSGAVRKSAKKR